MKKITLLQKAAMHECGHAVLYHLIGTDLDYIYAEPDGAGLCKPFATLPTAFIAEHSETLDQKMLEYGMICFAGYTAEVMLSFGSFKIEDAFNLGNPSAGYYPKNDFGDLRNQMSVGNLISNREIYDYTFFKDVHHLTCQLMRIHSILEGLFYLYNKLLKAERNFLDGDKVHNILEKFIVKGEGIDKHLKLISA